MGLKQAKKPLVHGWAAWGDLLLTCSLGRARTSLMRFFQSSISASLRGPGFGAAPGAGAGAAIVVGIKECKDTGYHEVGKSRCEKERQERRSVM